MFPLYGHASLFRKLGCPECPLQNSFGLSLVPVSVVGCLWVGEGSENLRSEAQPSSMAGSSRAGRVCGGDSGMKEVLSVHQLGMWGVQRLVLTPQLHQFMSFPEEKMPEFPPVSGGQKC